MVIGLFGTLAAGTAATGGTALAGATAGLATGTAAAAGAGSTALSILQGVMTAGSILTTVIGGVGSYQEGQTKAELARLEGTQAELAGEEKALRIKRDALMKAGAARVAFAASGVELTGSADALEEDIFNQAKFETGIEKSNAVQRALMARMKADQYERSATLDLVGAGAKAVGQAGNYGLDLKRRG